MEKPTPTVEVKFCFVSFNSSVFLLLLESVIGIKVQYFNEICLYYFDLEKTSIT